MKKARLGSVSPVTANPWEVLRRFTDARIALGRAGVSLPTGELLAFQLDHARARDAVHLPLDDAALERQLEAAGFSVLRLHSAAADRQTYLQRPDCGRRLNETSRAKLTAWWQGTDRPRHDLAIVVADGLSAQSVEYNALPLLKALAGRLAPEEWSLAPICIVQQGRVAVGDEVGWLLGADAVVVLIGERPGLSSPNSLGVYMTWAPQVGLTDASRNCISNVRPAGLGYDQASCRLHYLLSEASRRKLSGVELKDDTGPVADTRGSHDTGNFLITKRCAAPDDP